VDYHTPGVERLMFSLSFCFNFLCFYPSTSVGTANKIFLSMALKNTMQLFSFLNDGSIKFQPEYQTVEV